MGLRKFIIYLGILLLSFSAYASPARKGPVVLTQPDGTSFSAKLLGDEFTRIKTTSQGQAIIQDESGWWCYAIYDNDGSKICSGVRVGQSVPQEILLSSSRIPHEKIT